VATKLEHYVWGSLTRGPTADNEYVELCGLERGNLLRAGGERGVRAHINSIHSTHTKPVLKQGEMSNKRDNLLRAGGERGVRAHINSIHSAHTKPVLKQEVANNERGNLWRFPVRLDLFKKMDTIGV
jgi:hypothetical protein